VDTLAIVAFSLLVSMFAALPPVFLFGLVLLPSFIGQPAPDDAALFSQILLSPDAGRAPPALS
jgi:hypothetical protein